MPNRQENLTTMQLSDFEAALISDFRKIDAGAPELVATLAEQESKIMHLIQQYGRAHYLTGMMAGMNRAHHLENHQTDTDDLAGSSLG